MYRLEEFIVLEKDEITGQNYLLELETGVMFELNETAKRIVESIKENGNCDQYVANIVSQTELSEEKVRSDCDKFVAVLLNKGFIKEVED